MAETKAAGTAKEFMVGAAGGITQVIIGASTILPSLFKKKKKRRLSLRERLGQPFDIVKVRMQVQANRSAIQICRDIWRNEGALAFYKVSDILLHLSHACIH
jgi:solute carrier family 25 carnitine/acylcarnitine transporter 20/29